MKRLLLLLALSLVAGGCSGLDPSQVYEEVQPGLQLTQRCQAATQKALAQCGGADAPDCKSNVQEAQSDCSGAQGIFSAVSDRAAAAGGK